MRASVLAALVAASPVLAQPTMTLVGMGAQDLTPDGRTTVGFYYNAALARYEVSILTLGGALVKTSALPIAGSLRMSADARIISFEGGNFENLNNALNSITYDPSPARMWERVGVSTTWSTAEGRRNHGVFANGNRCDSNINTPLDISDDGRYLVGGMWTAGVCGPFRAFITDTATGVITQLPFSFEGPPASTFADSNAAVAVNANGSVIVGYDNNNAPTGGRVRRPCVWKRNGATWSQTVLDRFGGRATVVNDDGTYVGGKDSAGEMCRWHFTGSTWVKEVCAGGSGLLPTAMTGDGSVMVGDVFIWGPDINDGVALGIQDYAATLGGFFPDITFSAVLSQVVYGISDDGRKILLRLLDTHSSCQLAGSAAVLDLDGGPCIAPSLIFPPTNDTDVIPTFAGRPFGVILNVFFAGSWPMTFRWQKLGTDGEWADLADGFNCTSLDPVEFDLRGTDTSQLLIGFLGDAWRGRYRCILTNSCGSITTPTARVAACPADYNTDGGVDGDDVIAYFGDWDISSPEADFDESGGVDGDDIIAFFANWDQSC